MGILDFFYSPKPKINLNEKISKYFSLKDLVVTDTGAPNIPNTIQISNLKQWGKILDQVKEKIGNYKIVSGFRSPEVKKALIKQTNQAVLNSLHDDGRAADIQPIGMTAPQFMSKIALNPIKNSLGEIAVKKNVLHISMPTTSKKGYFMYVTSAGDYIGFKANELRNYISKNKIGAVATSGGTILAIGSAIFAYYYFKNKKKG